MRSISFARAAIVLTVAAGGISVSTGAAFAGPGVTVTCGEVITTSIVVDNDLSCPGDALSVEGDGVTLDLGGHTIRGNNTGLGVDITPANSNPQISNVTITNGTIANFDGAVHFNEAINPTLSDLRLTDNAGEARPVLDTGHAGFIEGLLIKHTHITGTTGFVMFAQIELDSITVSNTHISGGTMFLSQTGGPTFTDDTFDNTPLTLNIEGGTTITGSKFVDSPVVNNGFGFGGDVFKGNTFNGAGTALTLADVAKQSVVGNDFASNDIGVSLSDSPGDTISGNSFRHDRTAGVYFVDNFGPIGAGPLTVSGNSAKFNGLNPDGTVDPGGVAVEGGIFLYTPRGGATITDNTTGHNGGYGIYALPPTPGSGTNTASGNVSIDDFAKCYPLNTCTYK